MWGVLPDSFGYHQVPGAAAPCPPVFFTHEKKEKENTRSVFGVFATCFEASRAPYHQLHGLGACSLLKRTLR